MCCVLTLELTDLSLEGGEVLIHIILALGSNHVSRSWGLGPIALEIQIVLKSSSECFSVTRLGYSAQPLVNAPGFDGTTMKRASGGNTGYWEIFRDS